MQAYGYGTEFSDHFQIFLEDHEAKLEIMLFTLKRR